MKEEKKKGKRQSEQNSGGKVGYTRNGREGGGVIPSVCEALGLRQVRGTPHPAWAVRLPFCRFINPLRG